MSPAIKLVFGGDAMLGRIVADQIKNFGADFPLAEIAPLLMRGDVTIVNLECAITNSSAIWSGYPKAFYFAAPTSVAESLPKLGVDVVTLANNHILDFDYQGLHDTLKHLDNNHILHVGAGENLKSAQAPIIFESQGMKFGLVAFCDHQQDFAASKDRPGMAYLDLTNSNSVMEVFANSLDIMKQEQVEWPMLSLHWGPNMVNRPSRHFVELAHAVINQGYKTLFGHSAHVFHGIEIYKGYPIIYAAGDLVDDYFVDPEFQNDHQLLFEIEITPKSQHSCYVSKILIHPLLIEYCHVVPARGEQFDFIANRMIQLSAEFDCEIKCVDQRFLEVVLPHHCV